MLARINAMFPAPRTLSARERLEVAHAFYAHDVGDARRRAGGRVSREWAEACARYQLTRACLQEWP